MYIIVHLRCRNPFCRSITSNYKIKKLFALVKERVYEEEVILDHTSMTEQLNGSPTKNIYLCTGKLAIMLQCSIINCALITSLFLYFRT